jgi:hypothetical protein
MKPTQNTIIHVLLGGAVLTAIALLYLLLTHREQTNNLSLVEWAVIGGAVLALVLAVFLPILVLRWRGFPAPQPLSRSDIGFCVMVFLVGSSLAVVGVFSEMWWLMAAGIGLAPMAFMFRESRQHQGDQTS